MTATRRVSVVTPVYNTAAYLRECIESVLGQTYGDFEYVIADNCSTDESAAIALEYAARDPRIRVVRSDTFREQVPNYNFALAQISPASDYVKVVEADNALRPACLSRMVDLADRYPSVAVVSAYNVTETRVRLHGVRTDVEFLPGRDAARLYLSGAAYLFGSPTTVLMRAALVRARQPFYSERVPFAEDLSAVLDLLAVGDFGFVHDVLTFVRTENDSILARAGNRASSILDRYILLHQHGAAVFDAAEYEAVFTRAERNYYDDLALRLLASRDRSLLDWHSQKLALIGVRVSRAKLAVALARRVAWAVVNPGRAWRSGWSA
jgi:glycosyltransferase involved in cell wall biosynthesis